MKSTFTIMLGFALLVLVAIYCWPKFQESKPKEKIFQSFSVPQGNGNKPEKMKLEFGLKANFEKPQP